MRRTLFACIIALISVISASAQSQVEQNLSYEGFGSVEVYENFTVRLIGSDRYAVRIKADERIASYVVSYVKDGGLYIMLDKKSFTPELKKTMRGKELAAAALEAEVYAPCINSLTLNDKATLVQSDTIRIENFNLTMNGDARIEKLNVKCAAAEIALTKSAYASLNVSVSDRLSLKTENNAELIVNQQGGNLVVVDATGNSQVRTTVDVPQFDLSVSSSADLICIGNAQTVNLKAAGSSTVQAETLNVTEAFVEQTGPSKCYMNVSDKILVNLTGGSMMTFTQAPAIEVVRIVNSTLIKADDPKRK